MLCKNKRGRWTKHGKARENKRERGKSKISAKWGEGGKERDERDVREQLEFIHNWGCGISATKKLD